MRAKERFLAFIKQKIRTFACPRGQNDEKTSDIYIDSEVHTSDGHMDAVVQTSDYIYILEFKLNQLTFSVLRRIVGKAYAVKFAAGGRTVMGVGVGFDTRRRTVRDWLQMAVNSAAPPSEVVSLQNAASLKKKF